MVPPMRKLMVAGNWKMHGSLQMAETLVREIAAQRPHDVDLALFPPYPYLGHLRDLCADAGIALGAQDVSEHQEPGAYTGEVSASMVRDVGSSMTLVGHSERRQLHGDTDARVAARFLAARAAGLIPVLCVGETQQQRDDGQTEMVISGQLQAVLDAAGVGAFNDALIAYEPVWAIGTGRTATPEQAQEVHAFIRSKVAAKDAKIADLVRVLYGGSVKPANAGQLFAGKDVDGGLIGGAALASADFLEICAAAR